jgi:hypothetical protein
VAAHCGVPFGLIVVGVQLTATEVMVEELACTATVAVPDFVVSCVLVAVTVTGPTVEGAVSRPLAVIDPALALHVTAEL